MALLGDGWSDPQSAAIMALSAGLLGQPIAPNGFERFTRGRY